MTITKKQISIFSEKIANLYENILLDDIPEEVAYRGYLDRNTQFALNDYGYRNSYHGLLQSVFELPGTGEVWSEDGIRDIGHQLLLKLSKIKKRAQHTPDFTAIASELLKKLIIEFKEYACYIAVIGLSVEMPVEVGDVTFLPVATQIHGINEEITASFREKLHPSRDSLSFSKVTAEWRRSAQIHREKTEKALNVIRFFSSLIWQDQPTRHIFISSESPKRISDSLVVSPNGEISQISTSDFTPNPLRLDRQTIKYAEYNGLQQIHTLLKASTKSEIEQSFLTAVQWFGQATQEMLPLVAFVKYYISIESALKKPRENARSVIPQRLGTLLEPWDQARFYLLKTELEDFIDERNAVFHSGTPIKKKPEELQWDSRILARQALHQLRLKLASENWETKDDLIAWVNNQYTKPNSEQS